MPKKQSQDDISLRRILICGAGGFLLILVFTMLCAWLMSRELLPLGYCGWIGAVLLLMGCLFASLVAAKHPSKRMLHGFFAAICTFLSMLIAGMLIFSGGFQLERLPISLICVVVGGIGGVLIAGLLDR